MNVVITGASNGIGYHTALLFSASSGNRIICLSRNMADLGKLHDEAYRKNPGAHLMILQADLEALDTQKVADVIKDYGLDQIDILINNAGHLVNKPFEDQEDHDWLTTYTVNVIAASNLIRTLLPYLKNHRERAHIVNISSMGGVQGSSKFPGLASYSSSKGALCVLTECLAEEFKEKNITVNCLALGAVQTGMLARAFPGYEAPVNPEEIAKFIHDFAVNGPKYFNGKIIPVSVSTP